MQPTRFNIFCLFLLVSCGLLCLTRPATGAPPRFHTDVEIPYRELSPFPAPEKPFEVSLSPDYSYPLMPLPGRSNTFKDYDYTYDYATGTVTYALRLRRDFDLIPTTSWLEDFALRRRELELELTAAKVGRRSLVKSQRDKSGGLLSFTIPIRSRTFESIFGEGGAGLNVSGFRRIEFSGRSTWQDNASTAFNRQSKFPTLNMEQTYRFDITGTIGSKITVSVSQDSRNDIPLANRLLLRYKGGEDDILQTVEAGNTTLSLPATRFLQYATRVQGLFGIKATARIADVSLTAIASQEQGSTETIEVNAGTSSAQSRVLKDVQYKRNTRFDLGRLPIDRAASDSLPEPPFYDFAPGDSVVSIDVYVDDTNNQIDRINDGNHFPGKCYLDYPDTLRQDVSGQFNETGNFRLLSEGEEYIVNQTEFYIHFLRSVVNQNDILGVFMTIFRGDDGSVDTVGNISGDTLRLKLIKPQTQKTINHHVWEYEWKNIYDVLGRNIDVNNLKVNIYKGKPNGLEHDPDNPDDQNGNTFMQIMGLDLQQSNQSPGSDGLIDIDPRILDANLGLIIFPSRHPFDSDSTFYSVDTGGVTLLERVPEMYTSLNATAAQTSSEYYLTVTTSSAGSAVISLGATNIIEGSEIITYNGQRLVNGDDYRIDYQIGQLTLLNDEYTNINSNLSITFERAPFFSLAKKTLLGARAEYAPNRNFNIGSTILFKSDKTTNRKPKIGEETSKIVVYDADLSYSMETPFMTTLADAIPFVKATGKSFARFNGEFAQSLPNPNVDGVVYIDDFEGAKDSYSMSRRKSTWKRSSWPATKVDTLTERARIGWFNPDEFAVNEIWDRDVAAGENAHVVLSTVFQPVNFRRIPDSINNVIDSTQVQIPYEDSWNGFMMAFSPGVVQQNNEAQLLEFRMHTNTNGQTAMMHVDLGLMSEDLVADGKLSREDNGFGVFSDPDIEDVGFDGKADAQEFGYDPDNGVFDPAGDNWTDLVPSDINTYWHYNGSEKNFLDPYDGDEPDNEDLNGDGQLEKNNNYFSYKFNMRDTLDNPFYVEGSEFNGWITVRIPLRDPTAVDTVIGIPDWNQIEFCRLWFDSVSSPDPIRVDFASMELVSTTWGDSLAVADSTRSGPVKFDVAVISTETNQNYQPPPGVEGYEDKTRDVIEPEQSLLLRYENLNSQIVVAGDSGLALAADTGLAVKQNFSAENYLGYGRLQGYVNSDLRQGDSVLFFFRIGNDEDAYYEFRTILRPNSTLWDEANYIDINFADLSGVKARLLDDRKKGIDSSLSRVDGKYLVQLGPRAQEPTLTKVQYFAMGIVNLDPARTAEGEVWIDELRLTDVRDDPGLAYRAAVSGNMSDFFNYSFNYAYQDAFYRGVSQSTRGGASNNLGSGRTQRNYSFSGSLKLDKFFPRSFGLSLPLSFNWNQTNIDPLLKSGTDITVPEELKGEESSISISKGFSISHQINKNTKNPLFTLLLNKFSTSFRYNVSEGRSPTQPYYLSERINATARYSYNISKPPSIQFLKWLGYLKVPFGIPNTRLYLFPSRFETTGDYVGNFTESSNINGLAPTTITKDFNGRMNVGFKVFDNLTGSYGFTTRRDLRDPRTVNFSFSPKAFKLGVEQNYSQRATFRYTPKLFSFLTHSFDYSANYSDRTFLNSADSSIYHSVTTGRNAGFNATFDHTKLIGTNEHKGRGRRRPVRPNPADSTGGESSFSFGGIFTSMLKGVRYITDAIRPLTVTYSEGHDLSLPSIAGKASQAFRFGFSDDPGVEQVSASTGTIRQNERKNNNLSGKSGVRIFNGISVDVSYGRKTSENLGSNATQSISTTWPDVRLSFRSVKHLWLLADFLNKFNPSTGYTRSVAETKELGALFAYDRRVTQSFRPLISFAFSPFGSLNSTVRLELSNTESTNRSKTSGEITSLFKSHEQAVSFNTRYSFKSPSGIKLPIFGRIKFQSTVSLSVDVSYRKRKSERATGSDLTALNTTENETNLTVRPTASYSFSSTVNGGLSARWQDVSDKVNRRATHTRELGLWVEMRF